MNRHLAARILVFSWFILGGISHFMLPTLFQQIVPPAIPYPLQVVYISGAFELAGALGLWITGLRRYAGYGLILLTISVTPANVYMWLHAEKFSLIPQWLLLLRLPAQLLLLYIIWYATQDSKKTKDSAS